MSIEMIVTLTLAILVLALAMLGVDWYYEKKEKAIESELEKTEEEYLRELKAMIAATKDYRAQMERAAIKVQLEQMERAKEEVDA